MILKRCIITRIVNEIVAALLLFLRDSSVVKRGDLVNEVMIELLKVALICLWLAEHCVAFSSKGQRSIDRVREALTDSSICACGSG